MKILVVDDEPDVRTLFEQRFRREIKTDAWCFAFAHSGEEALHYLDAHPHDALLILSDISMPGMSGLELLRQVRQQYSTPPPLVMMITAYGDPATYERAMRLGANDLVTKPVDFGLLKEKLKRTLDGENISG